MSEQKRIQRNLAVLNKSNLTYDILDDGAYKIHTIWGEMLFYPNLNRFVLCGKHIYGNAKRMVNHLKFNNMV